MIIWLKVNVCVIEFVLAHLAEPVGEDDEAKEGEEGGEGVLEHVGADCVGGDLVGLLEGVDGDESDQADGEADDAHDGHVVRSQVEKLAQSVHVLCGGKQVGVQRADELESGDGDHVPAAIAPQRIDRAVSEQVQRYVLDEAKVMNPLGRLLVITWQRLLDKWSRLLAI